MRKRLDLDWLVELFDCDISSPDHTDAFYPWSAPAAAAEGAVEPRRGVSKPRCLPKVEGLLPPFYGHPDGSELPVEQSVEAPTKFT